LKLEEMFGYGRERILTDYGIHLIQRLLKCYNSVDEVVATILPTAAAAVPTMAQGVRSLFLFHLMPYFFLEHED
jgi:hypothetical protein